MFEDIVTNVNVQTTWTYISSYTVPKDGMYISYACVKCTDMSRINDFNGSVVIMKPGSTYVESPLPQSFSIAQGYEIQARSTCAMKYATSGSIAHIRLATPETMSALTLSEVYFCVKMI